MSELPDRQFVTSASTSESLASRWGALREVLAALGNGVPSVQATALWGSSRALLVAAFARATHRTTLVVTAGEGERHRAALDLQFLLSALYGDGAQSDQGWAAARVLEFPSAELSSWRGGRHREPDAERALCCHRLLSGGPVPIVATPAALSGPLLTPSEFRARTGRLAVGESLPREDLLVLLDWAGYERVDTVVEVGQWSLRGGIVDIFSPAHEGPVRAEFAGDEVESLRLFDPTTQRSHAPVAALDVLPLLVKGVGNGFKQGIQDLPVEVFPYSYVVECNYWGIAHFTVSIP